MTEQTFASREQEAKVPTVNADVIATKVGDKVEFDLEWRKEGDPSSKKGPINIPERDPPTSINFHLRDETRLNLRFKSPATEAMWVDLNGCPPQQPGNGGQISFNSTSPKLLRVTDANSGDPCTLYYMLRFDGDPAANGPPFEYDPEIRNGGGGNI